MKQDQTRCIGSSCRLFSLHLLRSLLVFVPLAGQADTHSSGHVAHTLGEEEFVQLSVYAYVAATKKRGSETAQRQGRKETPND